MTEKAYAIKSFQEVDARMVLQTEEELDRHFKDMKQLLKHYSKLLDVNKATMQELEEECMESIREDMNYALQYLNQYDYRVNVGYLKGEIHTFMAIHGLAEMIHRALILMRYFTPKGTLHSDILKSCYCGSEKKEHFDVLAELGISRSLFYKEKKQALRLLGYFFYEIVVPQARNKRFACAFKR
ncbi:MAG: hypothetical protein PHD56_08565 [Anaerostipes sp.]|nr:hypothetical protein [Anaerostipes sp.]MDD3504772.1 hypothetical protein [Eubacteriales bacterium]MDD4371111.1 hypothetical protein [Anaerostipes sp.]